ncbi:helix-turn-helix transcriptional regulator [Streptomyces sp. NPDC088124]|uniref:helix-turn-helix domain-containing protein n=1 Tax=Streptomyces sp. NPDC088124 TaxID=3154654 RepID=UPI003443CA3F
MTEPGRWVGRVPETTGAGAADEFAARLRELKDRSGLSYGALAKRLHMSTSTLHRYCNGTAVPNDYAPVERLARVCRATPQELVELHRHWILADAARKGRPDRTAPAGERNAGGITADPAPERGPETEPAQAAGSADSADATSPHDHQGHQSQSQSHGHGHGHGRHGEPAGGGPAGVGPVRGEPADGGPVGADSGGAAPTHQQDKDGEPVLVDGPREPAPPRRRRNALIASLVVAAVVGAVALAFTLPSGGGERHAGGKETPGGEVSTGVAATADPSAEDSASPSPSDTSHEPSASPSESARTTPSTSKGPGEQADGKPGGAGAGGDSTAVPLNVAVRPYYYENPCSQHFLVDKEPEQVGPPADEQTAPRWAAAYGAVSSGEQWVALTIQGTGQDTVVLQSLHVRVVSKRAPLAWNDYEMGNGCGGGVETKSFSIDLDRGSPTVVPKSGQRDFPYKVSETDPEVFYITAGVQAHDVRWDLSLEWSSGDRRGTVQINNDGTPFRTSARVGRPEYVYPLGGSEWIKPES